jgi:hypothetical protein
MGMEVVPVRGGHFPRESVGDFVFGDIELGICIAVLEKEIDFVFSCAPVDGDKVFKN